MNKTKIVCSIGPTSSNVETLENMIDAGMNVARFNMSHGCHSSHKALIDAVKEARKNKNTSLAILIDTRGPEIRIKQFQDNNPVSLIDGQKFVLTTKNICGTCDKVSVTYTNLPKILKKGDTLLLNDGIIELQVNKCTNCEVICTVVHGGELSNNKSINLPGIKTDMPYLSETDKQDILFAKEMNADYVAISFVNSEKDVKCVRQYLKEIDFKDVKIISKIESQEGILNFDKILKASDGIMVARGDLGVEVDFVKIPIFQKEIIRKCNEAGKVVITATQMLESMIYNPRPTRAEISDVANAIFDGTTAIMLSGETASGQFPVEAVETMKKIANEAEQYTKEITFEIQTSNTSESLGYAVYALAKTQNVKAIVCVTKSGETAENISKFFPKVPIIACTPDEKVFHKLSLLYGVFPVLDKTFNNMNDISQSAYKKALSTKLVKKGQNVVFVSGQIAGKSGSNSLLITKL